jgi:hypothetical protein
MKVEFGIRISNLYLKNQIQKTQYYQEQNPFYNNDM